MVSHNTVTANFCYQTSHYEIILNLLSVLFVYWAPDPIMLYKLERQKYAKLTCII